jgi:hypothetical protein
MDDLPKIVIVLEDDPSLLFLWEVLIEDIDPSLKLRPFYSAEEAESYLSSPSRPACRAIISDFYLPGGRTGLDFFDRARSSGVPFLLASAIDEEELLEKFPHRETWPAFVNKMKGLEHLSDAAFRIITEGNYLPPMARTGTTRLSQAF